MRSCEAEGAGKRKEKPQAEGGRICGMETLKQAI